MCLIRKLYSKLSYAKSETYLDNTPKKHPVSKMSGFKMSGFKTFVSKKSGVLSMEPFCAQLQPLFPAKQAEVFVRKLSQLTTFS